MVGVDYSSLQVDSQPSQLDRSKSLQPVGVVQHSSNEPGEVEL